MISLPEAINRGSLSRKSRKKDGGMEAIGRGRGRFANGRGIEGRGNVPISPTRGAWSDQGRRHEATANHHHCWPHGQEGAVIVFELLHRHSPPQHHGARFRLEHKDRVRVSASLWPGYPCLLCENRNKIMK